MKVLVEILHPAHVHVFKHAIRHWLERGDQVLVLSREKECANALLEAEQIEFKSISKLASSKAGLILEMLQRDVTMLGHALKFRPDVLVGIMGVTIVQVGRAIHKPAIVFYDTENAGITNKFVYPMAHSVCTPDCYEGDVKGTHVTYPSYHELAYLHPNRFTADPEILKQAGLEPGQPYFILRLVSWQASHDIGEEGLGDDLIDRLIALLEPKGRVLITSEAPLSEKLEPYRFVLAPETMHHFIAQAEMLIGESATMASEAAVLGVPAIYISDTGRGYTNEQDKKYGIVKNFVRSEAEDALAHVGEILEDPNFKAEHKTRYQKMMDDKTDATDWMISYIDSVVE